MNFRQLPCPVDTVPSGEPRSVDHPSSGIRGNLETLQLSEIQLPFTFCGCCSLRHIIDPRLSLPGAYHLIGEVAHKMVFLVLGSDLLTCQSKRYILLRELREVSSAIRLLVDQFNPSVKLFQRKIYRRRLFPVPFGKLLKSSSRLILIPFCCLGTLNGADT